MGIWSYYFFAKLLLFYGGFIDFHVLANLAFALALIVPLGHRLLRLARQVLAVPTGVALLYVDSFLPPIQRLFQTAGDLTTFTPGYLVELVGRFINPGAVAMLVALLLVWLLLAHRLRMSTFALLGIVCVPLVTLVQQLSPVRTPGGAVAADAAPEVLTQEALTTRLNAFYAAEAPRVTAFPAQAQGPAFDVIVLHLCSMAWDDVAFVDQRNDRLFGRFDVLFSQFNTAASYSGPAAVRVLRASCGQTPHEALYTPLRPECALMGNLARAGFDLHWALNHDGEFGTFAGDVERNLGAPARRFTDAGVKVTQRAFEGSPIQDDYGLLSAWWAQRLTDPRERVALYYNSTSLHDGNLIEGVGRLPVKESYERRLKQLLSDLNRFIDLVQSSGRRAVLVVVPEHGAAARGERLQISGLREIPTPAITQVPVGIKLLGPQWPAAPQQLLGEPASYLALSELLARWTERDPFTDGPAVLPETLRDLPRTEPVSENEGTVVMRAGAGYQMRGPDGVWSAYEPER